MTLAIATPVIAVCDNHGITIRTLNWNRVDKDSPRRLLVTHTRLDTASRATVQRDPRRFAACRQDDTALPNLSCMASLTGQVLKRVSTDSGWQVTRFDAASHAAWSIDSRGAVHTQAYDTLGRPQSGSEQLKGEAFRISWRHAYTDTGSADANAQKNNLRGLCVQRWDDSGLQTVESVALSGAIIRQTQQFLLSAQAQPDWPEDDAGRQALLEDKIYLSTISADARGNSLNQTDAMGNQQSWRYDISSHVKSQYATLSDGKKQTLLEGIVWSAASQILEENSGNGVTTTYRYEPETQRLSAMSALRADSIRLQDLDYGYDNTGNLISITDNTIATCYFQNQQTDGLREFTYDALYQLLEATGRENAGNTTAPYAILPAPIPTDSNQTVGYARSYRYDDSGNLLSLSHQGAASFTRAMAISDVSNRSRLQNDAGTLTPDDVDAVFDACGNLLNLQVSATTSDPLIWSASNHLQTVNLLDRNGDIQQSDREIYQYSAGMRMRKQTRILTKADSNLWTVDEVRYLPGLELRRHWQETITGDTVTSQEATEELHVITTQAGRAGIRVLHWKTGKPDSIDNDQARWQISDNIYALELDAQGQTISREEYYPFGGTAVWAARSELETSYKVIRYSGKERDGTGLYYYGYRYYAPWLCRWTAADPGQEIDGLNLYRMVRNNPLTLTDVDGLMPKLVLTKEEIAEFEHLYDSALKSGKYERNTPDMKRFVLTNHSRASTYSLKSESVINVLFHIMYQQSKYVFPPEFSQKAMSANKAAQAQAAQAAAVNGKKAILYVWAAQSHLIQNASPKERLNADKVVKHIRKLNRDPNASRDRHDFFEQSAHKGVANGIYELDGKTGEELAKLLDEYIKNNATLINKTLYRGTTTLPSVRPGRFTATSESQNIASLFGKYIETFKGGYGVRIPNIYCNRDEKEYLFSRIAPPKPVHSTTPRQKPLDPGAGCSKAA
ncbi:RHS repeat protein [Salmonella enterica subsp. houtenae]|nr:RHS repeat protein [Salmonella enterica subsp. houtenae]